MAIQKKGQYDLLEVVDEANLTMKYVPNMLGEEPHKTHEGPRKPHHTAHEGASEPHRAVHEGPSDFPHTKRAEPRARSPIKPANVLNTQKTTPHGAAYSDDSSSDDEEKEVVLHGRGDNEDHLQKEVVLHGRADEVNEEIVLRGRRAAGDERYCAGGQGARQEAGGTKIVRGELGELGEPKYYRGMHEGNSVNPKYYGGDPRTQGAGIGETGIGEAGIGETVISRGVSLRSGAGQGGGQGEGPPHTNADRGRGTRPQQRSQNNGRDLDERRHLERRPQRSLERRTTKNTGASRDNSSNSCVGRQRRKLCIIMNYFLGNKPYLWK